MTGFALYLDEDVHPALARILGARGFDVLTTPEAGMCGKSDEDQLRFATARSRVLLTFNVRHFRRLARAWTRKGAHHAGIMLSAQVRVSELLPRVLKCIADHQGQDMTDRVVPLNRYSDATLDL